MSNRRRAGLVIAPVVVVGMGLGTLTTGPGLGAVAGPVDLLTGFDLRIDGGAAFDANGFSVASPGDVNGDGIDDILIGSPYADTSGRVNSGAGYVVFGGAGIGAVDLADVGTRGFRMDGASANDRTGSSVAGAGDVNGDGLKDLIIGAPEADNNIRAGSGSSYVVFGTAGSTDVDLASLGARGFRIDGAEPSDSSGFSVAGAGDVNGDGLDDVVIGAPFADSGRPNAGAGFVVFGGSVTTPVDLAGLGGRGFRIDGASANDRAGSSVAGAGDVNGDGTPDLLIGSPNSYAAGRISSGTSHVVFGAASATDVDLATLGAQGFRIDGAAADEGSGSSVAGAGDINGDGRDDMLIGAPTADNNGRPNSGSTYVVFGKAGTATMDLATLGARGFRIDGAAADENSGSSVAGAGDINGDGRDDMLIGAPTADNNGRPESGSASLVLGGDTADLDLLAIGSRGLSLDGPAAEDYSGTSVAGAGDINGDGGDDLMIGAPGADADTRSDSGAVLVVFGTPPTTPPPATGRAATLKVKARKRTRRLPRTGRTRVVRRIAVGPGQTARTTVKVLPRGVRRTVTVKKTARRVLIRTRGTPKGTRIRVRITARGPGVRGRTWVRTWRVR